MRNIVILLTLCLFALGAHASHYDELKQQGDEAYRQENYAQAIALYNEVLADGQSSHEVYYNLGCAYYRSDELAQAILSYERALRLRPSDADTRENLALCYARTQDHIEALPRLFVVGWWQALVGALSFGWWQVMTLLAVLVLVALVAWFMLSRTLQHRRLSLLLSVVGVLLVVVVAAATVSSYRTLTRSADAIVMKPLVDVKAEPSSAATGKFELHEGTKVEVMEREGAWWRIRIADGNNGWIEQSVAEVI